MWSGGHWASAQGLTDVAHDSQQSRRALVTFWNRDWHSCCSHSCSLTHWLCFSASVIFLSPPLQASALCPTSILTAGHLWTFSLPPLSRCPHPVETEHPNNEMMKKYIFGFYLEKENEQSLFFKISNNMAKPNGCTFISALHAEPIKTLTSYTARLEMIRRIRIAPCHQFWLYTPFHN